MISRLHSAAEKQYSKLVRKQILQGIGASELIEVAVLGAILDQITLVEKHTKIISATVKAALRKDRSVDPSESCIRSRRSPDDE